MGALSGGEGWSVTVLAPVYRAAYSRVRLSVSPSVCLSGSWILSKQINISSTFFTIE